MINIIDKLLLEKNLKIKNIESLIETIKIVRPQNEKFRISYLKKLETERQILLKEITEIIEDEGDKEEL